LQRPSPPRCSFPIQRPTGFGRNFSLISPRAKYTHTLSHPLLARRTGHGPLPAYLLDAVKQCSVFFVENERSARRYLKVLWKEMVIDDYEWHTIHKAEEEVKAVFRQPSGRQNIGLISEAGCPGIADPGQILTEAAHEAGAIVKPLVGPSSILLALMASGLNGQQFRFAGYLPVDNAGRTKAIKDLEADSQRLHCTQIFIETPYRNNQLLAAILATCRLTTRLCIAANLTGPKEYIRTLTIGDWNKLAHQSPSPSPTSTNNPPSSAFWPELTAQPNSVKQLPHFCVKNLPKIATYF
jgi:16S rRNA (cytidine1402-2'-O)-methyltransferase